MYEKTCEHSAVAVLSGVCVHWIWQRGYFGAAGLREERKDEKKRNHCWKDEMEAYNSWHAPRTNHIFPDGQVLNLSKIECPHHSHEVFLIASNILLQENGDLF